MHKTIFITGGASGIGRAVAVKFGQQGWFVGIADINESGARETAAMLPAGKNSVHKLDVRDREAWDTALADCARASGGRIDVVFNNAGIPLGGQLIENTTSEIERCLDINLKGVLFGAQAAHPWLKASAPGSCLLNTASAAGIYGTPGASVYSATKFGVRAITESLDAEWAPDGIRVCDLMPGFIDTPLIDMNPNAGSNQDIRTTGLEAGQRQALDRHPQPAGGRCGQPAEQANRRQQTHRAAIRGGRRRSARNRSGRRHRRGGPASGARRAPAGGAWRP